MFLDRKIFSSCMTVIDKKDYREHLKHVCIEYNDEKKTLFVVGTNAQIMIINEIVIKNAQDQEFCKKVFNEQGKGYMLPDTILTDKKNPSVCFDIIDNKLTCNNTIVGIFDGTYPNWRALIPQKELIKARVYCGFNPDFIKLINKALNKKGVGVAGDTPLVSIDNEDSKSESIAPHIWKPIDDNDRKQMVLCMPLRLDY